MRDRKFIFTIVYAQRARLSEPRKVMILHDTAKATRSTVID
ncbi:MAG: hypothetical protein [Siphoviridae sp. ctjeG17]|nr:MAG: hypothetical protein [Siphoviridae sp. ctjeG17]